MITVKRVDNTKGMLDFVKFPFFLYKDSNNISLIKETLEDEFIGMIRKPNCEITTQENVTKLFDINE